MSVLVNLCYEKAGVIDFDKAKRIGDKCLAKIYVDSCVIYLTQLFFMLIIPEKGVSCIFPNDPIDR